MRATAPSGDASFEGVVAWSGELGYGVRSPEGGQTLEQETDDDHDDGHHDDHHGAGH
jgi:NADH-quinone oxidoreductase subunit I